MSLDPCKRELNASEGSSNQWHHTQSTQVDLNRNLAFPLGQFSDCVLTSLAVVSVGCKTRKILGLQ